MATCLSAAHNDPHGDRSVHVMRWVFRRQDDIVVCELGLNREESAYELRVSPPWNPLGISTEVFNDAVAAFERHGVVERLLIEDGWSLESFDSHKSSVASRQSR